MEHGGNSYSYTDTTLKIACRELLKYKFLSYNFSRAGLNITSNFTVKKSNVIKYIQPLSLVKHTDSSIT